MVNHLDEMKFFLDVAYGYNEGILIESTQEPSSEDPSLVNESNDESNLVSETLLEDLQQLKDNWLSITSQEDSEEYTRGYEEGLYKAVEMLETLIQNKYGRRL